MKKISLFIFLMIPLASLARERKNIDFDWQFILADSAHFASPDYNDKAWRTLDLPHDWAIEGDFSPANPSGKHSIFPVPKVNASSSSSMAST